jgi:DNA-binding NarL/FixJ family response regulator
MSRRKVLMVDDHAMVREGTRMLLAQGGLDCELVEAGTLRDGLAVLARHADIDWVMLDLGLPDIAGIAALDRLRQEHEDVPVVVLSASEERALVLECINHGAMGFIGKSATGDALVQALRLVFAGGIHLPPALFGTPATAPPPLEDAVLAAKEEELLRLGLTPRQIEVLDLMVQGLSNKAIAGRLTLSEATIKSHVAASLKALNVRNRTQAVFVLAKWRHVPGARPGPGDA